MLAKSYVGLGFVIATASMAIAEDQAPSTLPSPVKTCADIRAYIDSDGSMPLERLKSLFTAGGFDMTTSHNREYIAMVCSVARVRQTGLVQNLKLGEGRTARFTSRVVDDHGTCKIENITLQGCEPSSVMNGLPRPIKTCKDVLAYYDNANNMSMESYEALLSAAGFDMNDPNNKAFSKNECSATARAKHSILVQHIPTTEGGQVTFTAQVVSDKEACRLTSIMITGPSCGL